MPTDFKNTSVNAVIRGESEQKLLEVINDLKSHLSNEKYSNGRLEIFEGKPLDPNILPLPDYSIIEKY